MTINTRFIFHLHPPLKSRAAYLRNLLGMGFNNCNMVIPQTTTSGFSKPPTKLLHSFAQFCTLEPPGFHFQASRAAGRRLLR